MQIPTKKPTTFSLACPSTNLAFLESPTECEFYFGCWKGESTLFECPKGTAFDLHYQTCLLRQNVARCHEL